MNKETNLGEDDFRNLLPRFTPGYRPTTRFTSNSGSHMNGLIPEAYAPYAERIFASFAQPAAVTNESDVAEVVWRAAKDAIT